MTTDPPTTRPDREPDLPAAPFAIEAAMPPVAHHHAVPWQSSRHAGAPR